MKKIRGFRLGRRVVRVWRRVWRCRPQGRAYLRLKRTDFRSPAWSPPLYPNEDAEERAAMVSKISDWGRCLVRYLRASSRVYTGRGGGDDNCRHRLLGGGDEHGPTDRVLASPHKAVKRLLRRRQEEDEALWKTPPKGHLPVYVGQEDGGSPRRVLVPVIYFNHPLFGELLRGAEEEFGFQHPGGITIPCPISDFESVRTRVAAASGVGRRHSSRPAALRRADGH